VLKLDESRAREANTGKGPRVDIVPVLKTARDEPADWKYTTEKPGEGWNKPGFDDASWKTGKSGFGAKDTQGTTVGTEWNTPDVWLRREVELPADAMKDVALYVRHDDEAVVFINGVQASRLRGASGDYIERPLRADKNPLKPGKNLIAVHCNNAGGPQYIDLGLVRLVETKPTKE
jgi:hypothetical protein